MKRARKLAGCWLTILFSCGLGGAQQKMQSSPAGVDLTAISI
jgi:hypothetical protein